VLLASCNHIQNKRKIIVQRKYKPPVTLTNKKTGKARDKNTEALWQDETTRKFHSH
jgi:hypothetical protein